MAGQIILTAGYIDSPDYRGPAEIRIDPIFVPGKSCIAVQTQPAALDLAEKRVFQDGVIRLLAQRGLLPQGSYKLVPARRQALAGIHLFSGLRCRKTDVLETFCTSHGAVRMPLSAEAESWPRPARFSYQHRQVVNAPSAGAARILAASALPDTPMWSEFDLKQFKLESVNGRRHTFLVELVFSALDEERARTMVANLFGPLVQVSRIVVAQAEPRPGKDGAISRQEAS